MGVGTIRVQHHTCALVRALRLCALRGHTRSVWLAPRHRPATLRVRALTHSGRHPALRHIVPSSALGSILTMVLMTFRVFEGGD